MKLTGDKALVRRGDGALIRFIVMVSAADLWAQQGGRFFWEDLTRYGLWCSSLTDSFAAEPALPALPALPSLRTCNRGILLPV